MGTFERYIVKVEEGVPGSDGVPSKGPVYRSVFAKDGCSPPPEGLATTWDLFSRSAKSGPDNRMLGAREIKNGQAGKYVWQTYKQVYDNVLLIGSAMRHLGVEPKGRCGIYGTNCPEWFTTMEACNGHSIVCVPLYDTLGLQAVEFITNHAEISIAFVQEIKLPLATHEFLTLSDASIPTELRNVLKKKTVQSQLLLTCGIYGDVMDIEKHVRKVDLRLAKLQHLNLAEALVSFGTFTSEQKSQAKEFGVAVYSWQEFLDLGARNPVDLAPPTKHDLSTIMYTSGTTGEPKGVMLSHENVLTAIAGLDHFLKALDDEIYIGDTFFSFLPLAHIFDRVAEEMFVYAGASIGFWQGDIKKVPEDIAELKPTIFVGVPRVFDRLATGIQQKIAAAGGLKSWLFNFGFANKLNWMKKGFKQDKASPVFDRLVFNKVRMGLGGHVRLVLSGAAPLSSHVEEFLRVIMCAPVVQGYGLTETCAASFIQVPDVISMNGTVGPPMPSIDARLESVPELNYNALDNQTPRGEICMRGNTIFSGYYKREDLTDDALVDGWFHTGDIGEWQPSGAMKIIDRKKNIFKLSQGEYVAVENLENLYNESSAVDAIWVYGNSFESTLVAVAIPNQQNLENWAKTNGEEGDYATLCKSSNANQFILSELTVTGKKKGVRGFEFIKGVHLEPVPFDLERDLTTPTFKLKRPQLLKYYQKEIDALYTSMKSKQ